MAAQRNYLHGAGYETEILKKTQKFFEILIPTNVKYFECWKQNN